MSATALTLVLIAAVVHPAWNLLARRATNGDPIVFVWLTSALSAALYLPIVVTLAIVTPMHPHDLGLSLAMMAGTGLLHVVYFVLLQRGYRGSDFSVVYPLARGTGPLVTALAAGAFFGERLAAVQWIGIAVIVAAILLIAGGRVDVAAARTTLRRSLVSGVATGLAIAAYTLWDKQAVSAFAISPIVYDFGRTAAQTLILAPSALLRPERRRLARAALRENGREAIGVAILSPLAYVLVLFALTMAPVSLVAPVRESSIIIGAFIGARMLREGQLRRRMAAASLMLAGIVALARG